MVLPSPRRVFLYRVASESIRSVFSLRSFTSDNAEESAILLDNQPTKESNFLRIRLKKKMDNEIIIFTQFHLRVS